MESLNRSKFVTEVLYTNPSMRNHEITTSVDHTILQQDVTRFIKVQGDDFFEDNTFDKIMETWHYFQSH
jgi:hypothetical protein